MNNLALLYWDRGCLPRQTNFWRSGYARDEAVWPGSPANATDYPQPCRVLTKMNKPELAELKLRELAAFLRDKAGQRILLTRISSNTLPRTRWNKRVCRFRGHRPRMPCCCRQTRTDRGQLRVQSLRARDWLAREDAEASQCPESYKIENTRRQIPKDARIQLSHSLERICLSMKPGQTRTSREWKKKLAAYQTTSIVSRSWSALKPEQNSSVSR